MDRPYWLERLHDQLTEAREDMPLCFTGTVVFGALTILLHNVSTAVGEDYPSLVPLLETTTACFGTVTAIALLGFASNALLFFFLRVVYHPANKIFHFLELLQEQFSWTLQLIRRSLARVNASTIRTLQLIRRSLARINSSTILLVVATAVVSEIIRAFLRYIMVGM